MDLVFVRAGDNDVSGDDLRGVGTILNAETAALLLEDTNIDANTTDDKDRNNIVAMLCSSCSSYYS